MTDTAHLSDDRLRAPTIPRSRLATLPTPLEEGPTVVDGGPRLWVKRDDLTGLGGGGNKARKLEFLCGATEADDATAIVTVGAAQSNHCRMTAAAGARLGAEVHLVLSGDAPASGVHRQGNQLLSGLFGAQLHFTGAEESHWGELEIAREALTEHLAADGLRPISIPIGGSTAVGAVGYAVAFAEMIDQCQAAGFLPAAIVFTSSSGGTHAGLLAGRAAMIACGELTADEAPELIAIGVAKGVIMGHPDVAALADETLDLMGLGASSSNGTQVDPADVCVDGGWIGDDYAIPTEAGDAAVAWGARNGGWLFDRTYSGKGFSGALELIRSGRWSSDHDLVFIHTGGWPALFADEGTPSRS